MTDATFALEASVRTDMGKGASRRLRRLNDEVPAIVYGGKGKPVALTLQHNKVIKALENEAFYSHILELTIDGKAEKVVLKDLQRHPYKPKIQHMDFQRVSAKSKITMHVPLHYLNEEQAPGVKAGGVISHHITEVEIRCLPKDLPEFIEVDLGEGELDKIFHMSDIQVGKGVELVGLTEDNDQPIASIHVPKRAAAEGSSEDDAASASESSSSDSKE